MAAYSPRRRTSRPHGRDRLRPRPAATRLRPPPSAALIDAVLEHADLRDDMGGGRVMLRLSPEKLAEPRVRAGLGPEVARLGALAVIWDEREDCLFRVLDGAPPALALVEQEEAPDEADEPRFELTAAALEYIARSQSRGRP